jgi:23S rRNA (uracil1939-C5)-methyltransferase
VLRVGFATLRAHEIVDIDRCPILGTALRGAIDTAWAIAETLKDARKPLDIQVTATDAGMDVDVRGSGAINTKRTSQLAAVAEKHRLARLTRHGELVIQRTPPTIRIGRAVVTLPPGAFLQATAEGEAALSRLVDAAIPKKAKLIADLFCGVGPFALRLAERARITAADSDGGAIDALKKAQGTASGLKPIDAQARDLFRRPLTAKELSAFDAVVFDPPRQGAQAQACELAATKVPAVVAVSCNPATFARDARILIDGGYRLTRVTPVDQFRYSAHVELAGVFGR